MSEKRRVLHCWMGKREAIEDAYDEAHGPGTFEGSPADIVTKAPGWRDGTCMREAGHEGEHVFTDDAEIFIRFLPEEERVFS